MAGGGVALIQVYKNIRSEGENNDQTVGVSIA